MATLRTPDPDVAARAAQTPIDGGARATQRLLLVLSIVAGCTDVIGFLGLGGLFTNHITGNLVLLAAHLVAGGDAQVAKLLSVPVYVVMAGLTTLLAGRLQANGFAPLRPLLLLHFALLLAFLLLCIAAGSPIDANATGAVLAGMLGVSAMAVQNTLVQVSLEGMPPTGMMTGNVTRFAIDLSDVLLGGDPARVAKARQRAARTLPLIAGFAGGCGAGAALESAIGMAALSLPVALAAVALALAGIRPPR
ncbi:MAG TPA: DUF1275 family protein [Dokdonella sp.]